MKCWKFLPLLKDMQANKIDKEHYSFNYNGYEFDVIVSFALLGYEILVAIHSFNWGCVLQMDNNLNIEMNNNDYFSLCKILGLNWQNDHFNSSKFLYLLSEKAPPCSNLQGVQYNELRKYLPYRSVDEADKIYFCGWNDHRRDGRNARNFDKTEFYFGIQIANYCRSHNISSLWSSIPRDEKTANKPWDKADPSK